MRRSLAFALCLAPALAACGSGGDPPIPDAPSFETDVKPITLAHCVTCHNVATISDPNNGARPSNGAFDQFADPPGCRITTPDRDAQGNLNGNYIDIGPCAGFSDYVGMGPCMNLLACSYIMDGVMPPAPMPPLNARDKEILERWLLNPPAKP
jgi:hypothetical protein